MHETKGEDTAAVWLTFIQLEADNHMKLMSSDRNRGLSQQQPNGSDEN